MIDTKIAYPAFSALDGNDLLDQVESLDYEFARIYRKTADFASKMLGEAEAETINEAFVAFAGHVQGGDIDTVDALEEEVWAGYHPIPLLFARLRWYGELGRYHYTDGASPKDSPALKTDLSLAAEFHEWLPTNWVALTETRGKGVFGKVLQIAEARYCLDTGAPLTVDQIIVLSGLNRRSVMNAISKGGEAGLTVNSDGLISNVDACQWLARRKHFVFTKPYRPDAETGEERDAAGPNTGEETVEYVFVPVTDDGAAFLPNLRRKSGYQIGKYGEERYIEDYFEALKALQAMHTPRFRRPNAEGNWGIKVAVGWRRVPLSELRQQLADQLEVF